MDESQKKKKAGMIALNKATNACLIAATTIILVATSIIAGVSSASATVNANITPFSASEEPQQQQDGGGPAQDLGTTDVTPTPDTNATEPGPTGTIVNNTSGVEPTRNESAGAGEATTTGPAQIGPIGPIDTSPICDILPEGCPTGHECPPECLILAQPSDIQQGNIAAFEFTSTVNETASVANQSREVPITESQLIVGTPEQIKSIVLEKFRATTTDQTAISQLEGDISAVVDPAVERGLAITIHCSYEPRTDTWTWTIYFNIGRY